jgi:hypothetical protein
MLCGNEKGKKIERLENEPVKRAESMASKQNLAECLLYNHVFRWVFKPAGGVVCISCQRAFGKTVGFFSVS